MASLPLPRMPGWGRSFLPRLLWEPPLDFPTFRNQETGLIAVNVLVMLALMGLHVLFQPAVAPLSILATEAFAIRCTMQVLEAVNLNRSGFALGPGGTRFYARFSIGMNVAFTALVATLCGGQESHYAMLFVVPVIAAAFRETILGLSLLLSLVSLITVGLVWVPLGSRAPATDVWESFAAITVSLIFLVVAAVVRMLAVQLWRERAALERTLVALDATRDQLVREEKLAAVGRLSAAIAHEVRNPASMISSAASMAQRPDTSEEVRTEVLGIVTREARRLELLTADFLAYGRERTPELRATTVEDTIEMVAGICRARAQEAGLSLSTACAPAPVRLDPFMIQQALLNVALNGIEATPVGGSMHLSGGLAPGQVIFAVENSGPALPPTVAARAGEPFYTTKASGTGLGLAITANIAASHGGTLVLAENLPGKVRWELRIANG
jgi:signal transduction histidine kinase